MDGVGPKFFFSFSFSLNTSTTIFYLLCLIMLQCLKKNTGRSWDKVLKFWAKLDTNHPLNPNRGFFSKNWLLFLSTSDTPSQYYNGQKNLLKRITKYKAALCLDKLARGIFFLEGEGGLGGGTDYSYFCQSIVPLHT